MDDSMVMNSDDAITEAADLLTGGLPDGTLQLIAAYLGLFGAPPPNVPSDAIDARVRALAEAHDL